MNSISEKIIRCQAVFENEFFDSAMNLIYDERVSLEHKKRFRQLPTPEEIAQRLPNPCGWATGMEDSVINGGVALGMYLDAGNAAMARKIYTGLRLCGTISGLPGFVARSVSPHDQQSFYPESSRDQYTHYVYGLWEYFHSPLSSDCEKNEIARLLTEVAEFCEKYVTPANDYTLPRADFGAPRSTVCKLWEVQPHEAARLPMFYAAAWSVSGDQHWFDMYRQYAVEAAEAGNRLEPHTYCSYALLQMCCSCRLIHDVESDPELKACYAAAMRRAAEYVSFNLLRAADVSYRVDYAAMSPSWRQLRTAIILPGSRHVIPEMPEACALAARNIREIGEIILIRLLLPEADRGVPELYNRIFQTVMAGFAPETYCTFGLLYPVAAWHKALKFGIHFNNDHSNSNNHQEKYCL